MKKSELREIIREELLSEKGSIDKTDIREKVLSARNDLSEALNLIASEYGKIAEYKQLLKAFRLVDKWHKDWK